MDNGEFLFIDESGLRSEASRKRQVRSFAARNARGRKQRVREYQDSKSRESGHQQTTTANEISTVMVRSDKDQDVIPAGHSHLSTNLSAARTDPFDSFSRKVSQSEWFLFDHFVRHVIWTASVCLPALSAEEKDAIRSHMGTKWLQMAMIDAGMLGAVLLFACRNLASYGASNDYSNKALQYGGQCISSLREALAQTNPVPSDLTIAKTMALASDATATGDIRAAQTHLMGLEKLGAMKGLPKTSGYGLPGNIIIWFLKGPAEPNALVTPKCISTMALLWRNAVEALETPCQG
ncbi:hypothetical protein S40285_09435 [Stachybotrys chlorohalonatus IBT 40285]|uniref:Uncharacterized protein n=1 Tax=Stachybotrys chlorohalonatus (strain IBT 40285) TaxID=1283841 RepID=A0A084QDG7_STAC4|nr:hypothetical protein S40285_09435 [Stachybotrys chlorohalonata IBT 40285]